MIKFHRNTEINYETARSNRIMYSQMDEAFVCLHKHDSVTCLPARARVSLRAIYDY